MIRSIFSSSQIPSSIIFLSSVLAIIFVDKWPDSIETSFTILLIGSVIGLILSYINPINHLVKFLIYIPLISKIYTLPKSRIKYALDGIFAKQIVDQIISKI